MLPSSKVRIGFVRPGTELALASLPLLIALAVALNRREMSHTDAALRSVIAMVIVSSLWLLWVRVRRRPLAAQLGAIIVYGSFFLWYAYPSLLFVAVGPPEWYSFLIGWQAPLAVSVLLFGMALGLSVRATGRRVAANARRQSNGAGGSEVLISLAALVLLLVGLTPYLGQLKDPNALAQLLLASRSAGKPWVPVSNLGASETLLPAISVMALTAGAALLASRLIFGSGSRALRTIGLVSLMALVTALVLDHGTRAFLMLTFGPAAIILLYRIALRSRVKAVAAALVFALIMVSSAQVVGVIRNTGWQSPSGNPISKGWYNLGGSVDYFSETAFAISLVPRKHEFFRESTLLHFLTYPVPRALWPGKPVPRAIRFYVLERWNQDLLRQGGTVFPGIIGQQYMSWGFPGVFALAVVLGILGNVFGAQVSKRLATWDIYTTTAWLMLAIWLFLSFRALSPVFLTPALIAFGVIFLTNLLRSRHISPAFPHPSSVELP